MAAFTFTMSSPVPSGFTRGLGGPNVGGHVPPDWWIQYAMDLGAKAGTEVRAAFDSYVLRLTKHIPSEDTAKVYGAKLFLRSPNNLLSSYYTHITAVPKGLGVGSRLKRGDLLGKVVDRGATSHLHLALAQLIGGRYRGVDLYALFLALVAAPTAVKLVTFNQDGSPPIWQ